MDGLFFLIILLLGGLMTVIGAIVNHLNDKKRREIMTTFANEIGLDYRAGVDNSLLRRFSGFRIFATGRAKKVKNLIYGASDEETMCIFDFQYSVGSGKNQSVHRQTVISIESEHFMVPAFVLKPGGFFSRSNSVPGMSTVEFDMYPDFARRQILQTSDEETIKRIFDDRMIRYFEENSFCIEATTGKMVCYIPKRSFRLEEMRLFMEKAFEIYRRLLERSLVPG